MYNLDNERRIGKMTFRVRPIKMEAYRKVAYPACKKSEKFCQLLRKTYILPEELKALELAGYHIEYEKTYTAKEPFYTRGVP